MPQYEFDQYEEAGPVRYGTANKLREEEDQNSLDDQENPRYGGTPLARKEGSRRNAQQRFARENIRDAGSSVSSYNGFNGLKTNQVPRGVSKFYIGGYRPESESSSQRGPVSYGKASGFRTGVKVAQIKLKSR